MDVAEPRTVFIAMMLLPFLGAITAVYHGGLLQKYVRHTRRISDIAGLAKFQKVVARQMYAALAQLILLTTPMILYAVGILTNRLRLRDIAYVVIPATVVIFVGYYFKKVEAEACRIPALGDDLEEQRLAIIKTWKTKPFPNW